MKKRISYRPDIDGLRGIAVLLVVFFHLEKILIGSKIFQGGYLGVDIFFVISGYLISYIIFDELKNSNSFSFVDFYLKRIKRILPVLCLVILSSILCSYFLFITEKFNFLIDSANSSLFFYSNIFFWKGLSSYYAEESINIPLLHTWSLGVEEQFYILFPLLFFFIFFYFKKRFLNIIFFIILFSFILSLYGSFQYPNANFYLLPSRLWEILSGSVLAYFEIFEKKKNNFHNAKKYLVISCLILLILSFKIADNFSYHPSFVTLIPVLSTICIIYFYRKNFFIYKILSSKLLVYIGLISYSLYLWHYPIFVFFNHLNLFFKNIYLISFFLLFFTILISSISYHLIEKPFRNGKYNFKKLIIFIFFILTTVVYIKFRGIDNQKFINKFGSEVMIAMNNNKQVINCYEIIGDNFCSLGKKQAFNQTDVVMLGDSVLVKLVNKLNDNLPKERFRVINLSKGGSLYAPFGKYINLKNGKDRISSKEDFERTQFLNETKNDKIIIIGAKYRQHLNDFTYIYVNELNKKPSFLELYFNKSELFKKGLIDSKKDFINNLEHLLNDNKIILIYPFPEFSNHFVQAYYSKKLIELLKFKTKTLDIDFNEYLDKNYEVLKLLDKINHKNLYKIYPHDLFCKKGKCSFIKNDKILYYDQIHLTEAGAELINKKIIETIGIIQKN